MSVAIAEHILDIPSPCVHNSITLTRGGQEVFTVSQDQDEINVVKTGDLVVNLLLLGGDMFASSIHIQTCQARPLWS